jgi:two-component system, OmpR family, response regulator
MPKQVHVLVVDDDARIRNMLRRYLADEGLSVSEASDGDAMREVLEREAVDIVLLDLVMPGEDGLSLARHIRQNTQIPIIMLTGKGDLIDRVVGLEAGADDYVAKPFHLREVLARIRTVLRRGAAPSVQPAPKAPAPEPNATLRFEGWRLDLAKRQLARSSGEVLPLTSGEFDLLAALVQHANRVLSRAQLMDMAKGRESEVFDRAVDTQIGRLRKKIEADPDHPRLIKTIRGAGYVFVGTVSGS